MANVQQITDFLVPYSGEVKDIPPDQFIPFIQIVADALVDTIKVEHTTGGGHVFGSGNIADRPLAANASWYVSTDESGGPKAYYSDGTTWPNLTDINATNLPFSDVGFPALTKISTTLTYILGAMQNSGNNVLGSKVKTTLTSPNILAPDGILDDQLNTIDSKLSAFDATKIPVAWGGTTKHLQQAITDAKAQLDNISNVAGAGSVGFDPSAGSFRHIQPTDTTMWAAIKRLDEKLFSEGVDRDSTSLTHTAQGDGYYGDAVSMALSAVLNLIENAMTRMPIAFVIHGCWLDTLISSTHLAIANNELIGMFQFPELCTAAGLGSASADNIYIDHFAARFLDADSIDDDCYIDFRYNDGATKATVTIPNGSDFGSNRTAELVLSTDMEFVTVYVYVAGGAWTKGDPANIAWSARLVIHRNVGDHVS